VTTILAIDPGPERSAWIAMAGERMDFGIYENDRLVSMLRDLPGTWFGPASPLGETWPFGPNPVVIEKIESFGMAVGAEVFETVYWSGRFAEAAHPLPVHRIGRKAVKLHLCGQSRAKDPNVRQALIDRFGGPSAIGKKASPGPLYGISGDVWSALAVAVTFHDQEETKP
jgi:hypothetical protein